MSGAPAQLRRRAKATQNKPAWGSYAKHATESVVWTAISIPTVRDTTELSSWDPSLVRRATQSTNRASRKPGQAISRQTLLPRGRLRVISEEGRIPSQTTGGPPAFAFAAHH